MRLSKWASNFFDTTILIGLVTVIIMGYQLYQQNAKDFEAKRLEAEQLKIEKSNLQRDLDKILIEKSVHENVLMVKSPNDGENILWHEKFKLEWLHPRSDNSGKNKTEYYLDLISLSTGAHDKILLVAKEGYNLAIGKRHDYGEYFWKVSADKATSGWRQFGIYESSLERMISQEEVLIGTSLGPRKINELNGTTGANEGFEIDFIKWVIEEVRKEMNLQNIATRFIYTPWDEKFKEQVLGKVDISISQLTINQERNDILNLEFSHPYFLNEQALFQNIQTKKPLDSTETQFVVVKGSINHDVAKRIQENNSFNYKIIPLEPANFIGKFFEMKADYFLVDSIAAPSYIEDVGLKILRVKSEDGKEFKEFYDEVKRYNQEEHKMDFESFGILINTQGGNDLLTVINSVLNFQSDSKEDKLEGLRKCGRVKEIFKTWDIDFRSIPSNLRCPI